MPETYAMQVDTPHFAGSCRGRQGVARQTRSRVRNQPFEGTQDGRHAHGEP